VPEFSRYQVPHPEGDLHALIELAGCLAPLDAGADDARISRGNCGIASIGVVEV
jgi:hypothetical protein